MRLFISMSRRSAIVSPASERVRPTTTESWLGAPKQRTATVVCVGVGVGVRVRECVRVCACVRPCMRACVMCLQIRHTADFPSAGIPAIDYLIPRTEIDLK